jgi:hypothetical protein
MAGMKISLDAAMRARDVSPSRWQDQATPDRDETSPAAPADVADARADATDAGSEQQR